MKRRTFLTYVGLGWMANYLPMAITRSSSVVAQETPDQTRIAQAQTVPILVNVKQFGPLVSGITNNPQTIAANTVTIQAAINAVGRNGGGSVYIPTGQYQVAPPNLNAKIAASLVINYNNITLVGDGIGKTIIHSRGSWSVINGNVIRGHGILIKGTSNAAQPRKNITIKNLELTGGTKGFTGNRSWPANPSNGDGWDISHKGIILDFNKALDNITIDSVYVHDFRGEVIYAGGMGVGKVTISNTKIHNSNGSMLSLDADLIVTNCEFSQTANAWVENAPVSAPNKSYFFSNCVFKNSIANGLVIAQGNFPAGRQQTITNCSFQNSPAGVCIFGGASNFVIKDNNFIDCTNALVISGENRNIQFYRNQIQGINKPVITANIFGTLNNVVIRNNYHTGAEKFKAIACIFYFGNLRNIVIANNIFKNCRTPEQSSELVNERPLFRTNQYINVERRELQGYVNFWQQPPYIIEPKFEQVLVANNSGKSVIEVVMSSDFYVDGQEVLFAGGASNARVKFPRNSSTIQCLSDRYLVGQAEQLILKFNKSTLKWYELSYLTGVTSNLAQTSTSS